MDGVRRSTTNDEPAGPYGSMSVPTRESGIRLRLFLERDE
jgi:hypothetical protein